MTQIVKIDAAEFGLEETKAKQISDQFKPMLDKMEELENKFNQVQQMEMSPEKVKEAKELRLKYVKVRTGTAAIHKEQKAFYLAGGRYVDGWKNAQVFASQGIEEKLSDIESHYAKIEAEKIENLRIERWNRLEPYMESEPSALGVMEQGVFKNLLMGAEASHKAKIEAEIKSEEDRIAKEKKEAEEREAQRIENIRLKKEAEEREAAIEKERKEREAKEAIEAKQREKEIAEQEAKLRAERDAREKAEAAIQAQKESEKRARKKEENEAKKAAKAPVKNQLTNWVNSLEMPILNTSKISDQDKELAESITQKFEGFKSWAQSQIENY